MVMRHVNRRQFASGFALATVFGAGRGFAQEAGVVQLVTVRKTRSPLLGTESPSTEHLHFKTPSGLPVLRARQGQEFHFRLVNETEEDIFLHFFGVRGAGDVMTVHVPQGPSSDTEVIFTPPDAGTFWFGPLLQVSRQRELGLSGMLIVEELTEQPYQDITIILDDWLVGDDGVLDADYANLNRAAGEGRLGNWFTVNGQLKPHITLDPEKPARLRLLNVANTRNMNVMFKGVEGVVLARDGQPAWPTALSLQALSLAPGQRVDVLLLEAQELVVIALDLFEDVVEAAFLHAPGYGRKTLPRDIRLPDNPVAKPDLALPPRTIPIVLEGGLGGGLQQAMVGKDTLDLRAMLEQGLTWSIGGRSGLGSPPLFEASSGETLILNFENRTKFEQVLHLHGHVWTQAMPLTSEIEGPQMPLEWTDTLKLPANGKARVLMVADNPGTWAIQSLLAERCDAGLIAAFTVADMP